MCMLNLDSFLISTKNKINTIKKKIITFFEIFPCVKKRNRKDSNSGVSFVNPYYDPNYNADSNYELREVVVIPNNPNQKPITQQPLQGQYFELDVSNNLESNVFPDSESESETLDSKAHPEESESRMYSSLEVESDSDYDLPIFSEKPKMVIKEEPIYENVNNIITQRILNNEDLKLRELVFEKIKRKRVSYSKSLSDIGENSTMSYSDDFELETDESQRLSTPESEISEHIYPEEEDSFMDNLEEKYNHQISKSQISIRSEDLNQDSGSEDNWDVLSD